MEAYSEMRNPIANIVARQYVVQRQSRIPFAELCGYYALLWWGAGITEVATASGLNRSSIAHLKAAGQFRGGQIRYPKVAAEFERLGIDAFSTTYLSAEIRNRYDVAVDRVRHQRTTAPKPFVGSNPRASKHEGVAVVRDPLGGPDIRFTVDYDHITRRPGWVWRDFAGYPSPQPGFDGVPWLRGDPRRQEQRFYSSTEAYEFCLLRFAPTKAQLNTPEYEAANDDSYFFAHQDELIQPAHLKNE
jgi:hypothetical protein